MPMLLAQLSNLEGFLEWTACLCVAQFGVYWSDYLISWLQTMILFRIKHILVQVDI